MVAGDVRMKTMAFGCGCGRGIALRIYETKTTDTFKINIQHASDALEDRLQITKYLILNEDSPMWYITEVALDWTREVMVLSECGFIKGAKVETW